MYFICNCLCPDNRAEGPRTHHSSYYRTFLHISHTVSYSKLYYKSSCIFRCISGRLTTAESGQSSEAAQMLGGVVFIPHFPPKSYDISFKNFCPATSIY